MAIIKCATVYFGGNFCWLIVGCLSIQRQTFHAYSELGEIKIYHQKQTIQKWREELDNGGNIVENGRKVFEFTKEISMECVGGDTLDTRYPLWSLVRLPYYNLTLPVEMAHHCPPHGAFVGLALEIVTSAQHFLNYMYLFCVSCCFATWSIKEFEVYV